MRLSRKKRPIFDKDFPISFTLASGFLGGADLWLLVFLALHANTSKLGSSSFYAFGWLFMGVAMPGGYFDYLSMLALLV